VSPDDSAVIFDVDGVLLDLTATEEDVFFAAFAPWCPPASLSRDWSSYGIRNDDNIVDEIMAAHAIPARHKAALVDQYHAGLAARLADGSLKSQPVEGAADLLTALHGKARLGIATANFREAARLRLVAAGLWEPVSGLAQGADGGGHKHAILARVLARLPLPRHRIVYVGDNVNDVAAGLKAGVHFIGFSRDPARLPLLREAGARHLSNSHCKTENLIDTLLNQ
jgi:phosphoglycolate phosphatase-like HAD superfamily hydrolase